MHKRDHSNQVVERLCRSETCDEWFYVSDRLFEQQFCCKACKRNEANRRKRRNRLQREMKQTSR